MQKIRKIPCKNLVEFYFLIWIHSIQGKAEQPLLDMELQEKE